MFPPCCCCGEGQDAASSARGRRRLVVMIVLGLLPRIAASAWVRQRGQARRRLPRRSATSPRCWGVKLSRRVLVCWSLSCEAFSIRRDARRVVYISRENSSGC